MSVAGRRFAFMFDDLQVPFDPEEVAPGDCDVDYWSPDAELDAAACAVWTEREAAEQASELSVHRLDADATLDQVDVARRQVNLAEVRQLDLVAHWADLNAVCDRPGGPKPPGAERLITPGGDGTPAVAEFAPAELAIALQVTVNAAGSLVADALDLRHRFPLLWDRLHTGDIPVWQASKTAQTSRGLSREAAGQVDRQIAGHHGHLPWARLKKALDAAILRADPPKAMSDAEQAAAEAGVSWRKDDVTHGYGVMIIKAAAGDLEAFDQALDVISRSLKVLGDPRPADQRRATAIAILADPDGAKALVDRAEQTRKTMLEAAAARRAGNGVLADTLDLAVDRRPLVFTNAVLYLHLTRDTLDDILNGVPHAQAGVVRIEDIGPVIADQARQWLRHSNVTVKPVIDLAGIAPVDRYETPPRIAEAIGLIHPADYSSYATSTSRHQDNDHPEPRSTTTDRPLHHRPTAPATQPVNQAHVSSPDQNARRLDRQTGQTRRLALAHPPRLVLPRRPPRHHCVRSTLTQSLIRRWLR